LQVLTLIIYCNIELSVHMINIIDNIKNLDPVLLKILKKSALTLVSLIAY